MPTSNAGSVAHFRTEVLTANILHLMRGEPLSERSNGHANGFIGSGYGKAFLIDFNYLIQPVTGHFPLPGVRPFSLLKESRVNHWGKLAFRWVYWTVLLKAGITLTEAHWKVLDFIDRVSLARIEFVSFERGGSVLGSIRAPPTPRQRGMGPLTRGTSRY